MLQFRNLISIIFLAGVCIGSISCGALPSSYAGGIVDNGNKPEDPSHDGQEQPNTEANDKTDGDTGESPASPLNAPREILGSLVLSETALFADNAWTVDATRSVAGESEVLVSGDQWIEFSWSSAPCRPDHQLVTKSGLTIQECTTATAQVVVPDKGLVAIKHNLSEKDAQSLYASIALRKE